MSHETQGQDAEASLKRLPEIVGRSGPGGVEARVETRVKVAAPFKSKLAPAWASRVGGEITASLPGAVGVPAATAPAPAAVAAEPATPLEEARFAFAYFPISDDLAVINELPWAKSAAVSSACRQLLAAILKALSVPCEEKALTSMVFTWPLDDGPDVDRSAQSARHMLDGFMARRFKLRPVRHLLILAEQSAGYLFPTGFDWQQDGLTRHPHHAVDMVVTRSLNAMDAVPDIKRSVWQALQPLRAALANPARNADGSVSNGQ